MVDLVQSHHMKVMPFNHMTQPLHPLKDLWTLIQLTAFLKKQHYDIIHTHNSKAGFIGRLAARLAGVPVIIHTVHGFAFHDQEPIWRQVLFRALESAASRWCDKMIFISQPLIDWALRERIVNKDKIIKIYSGIELDQFQPVTKDIKNQIRTKWGLGPHDSVIGIVSKLWEGKGHAVLIEAFQEIKNRINEAKLVIVGEGYLQDHLSDLVQRYGLNESVLFTGFQKNVSEIIATFDVAILPSFFEGMGRVLLEAMAMEKPVVASRVGGIPDLVDDGLNGFLISPGDVKELSDAIMKVLTDKDMADHMGKQGRKKVTDQFSAETMVQSIEKIYTQCLQIKEIGHVL